MDKLKALQKIKQEMLKDNSLPLKKEATNLVFGDGNPNAEIFFLGEGPGYWEDQKGIPFVGNAGSLLNQLLRLINIKREDVFITNVIHYRPPANRDPTPEEIEAFSPYLDRIIAVINPKVFVTLGRFSMGKFLPNARISSVHGKVHKVNWRGRKITVVPMYHPAAALRNNDILRQIKEDFLKLPEILEKARELEKPEQEVKQMQLI